MFDFDVGKLMLFGIVAIAVIPPKDLPRVMRTVGQYVGKMRRMASDFQGQFMQAMREADLESVQRELKSVESSAKLDSSFDPVMAMRTEMSNAIEPPKTVTTSEIPAAAVAAPGSEPFATPIVAEPLRIAEPEPAPSPAGAVDSHAHDPSASAAS